MAFKNCFLCEGKAKSTVVLREFDDRKCGHFYCVECKITHDEDVDDISTKSLTAEDIQNISSQEEYRKLFVEVSQVRDEDGNDYGMFKWDDQKELRQGVSRHMVDSIKRQFPKREKLRILDVGCASGFTTITFAETFPNSTLVAVDPSPQVKEIDGFNDGQVRAIQSTLQGIDFGDEKFDVVVIVGNVMLHDDPLDTLSRAVQLLSDGGLLIFDFKNIRSSPRVLCIWLARLGLAERLPKTLFERNFLNMRFGYNESFLQKHMANEPVQFVCRKSKPPRLLEFGNKSNLANGWKGLLWRFLNFIDARRGQQAWLQLEFTKK